MHYLPFHTPFYNSCFLIYSCQNVTSAVQSVSYGAPKDKVYVGKLSIIGLTTRLLSLSGLVYFGGKQPFSWGGSLVLDLDLGGTSVLNFW